MAMPFYNRASWVTLRDTVAVLGTGQPRTSVLYELCRYFLAVPHKVSYWLPGSAFLIERQMLNSYFGTPTLSVASQSRSFSAIWRCGS